MEVLIQHRILLLKCCDLRLSLSLRLLTHWVTSTKLTMKSHRLRIPSKIPHIESGMLGKRPGNMAPVSGCVDLSRKNNSQVIHPHGRANFP